jgi:hypothetical protein
VKLVQAVKHDSPLVVGDIGATLLLEDEAAEFAVTQGFGIYLPGSIPIVALEPLIPDKPKVIDPRDLLGPEGQKEADEARDADSPEPPAKPKRPYGNAPKSAWVEYVVAIEPDMTFERADGMSKSDLMSGWGQRL